MVQGEVKDIVIHLEESMELTSMESGIRLIRAVLADKTLNKWGIRNVLRSSWREFGDIQIKGDPLYLHTKNNVKRLA
ncbi:hypothetical protein FF1_029977 [Malus domestica]